MKLLGRTKGKIIKDKNGENVPDLEITEIVFVRYNIVNNNYQKNSRILYTFLPNKSFGQLINISPANFIFLKALIQNFYVLKYGLLIRILKC